MSAGQESGSPIRENRTLLPAPLPPDEARGTLAAAAGLSTVGLRPPFDSPAAAFSSRLSRRSHLDCRAAPHPWTLDPRHLRTCLPQVSPNLRISPLSIPLGSLSPVQKNAFRNPPHLPERSRSNEPRPEDTTEKRMSPWEVQRSMSVIQSRECDRISCFLYYSTARGRLGNYSTLPACPAILKERNFLDSRIHKSLIQGWDAALALFCPA